MKLGLNAIKALKTLSIEIHEAQILKQVSAESATKILSKIQSCAN